MQFDNKARLTIIAVLIVLASIIALDEYRNEQKFDRTLIESAWNACISQGGHPARHHDGVVCGK